MNHEKARWIWGVVMTAFYLIMALLIIFTDILDMERSFRIILGVLFLAYGVFRGYRMWKMPPGR